MNMSKACLPPNQPEISTSEMQHPRYREYRLYRSAMDRQLVTATPFALWLELTEKNERGSETVYEVKPGARLAQGWWKNAFGANHHLVKQVGPFKTKAEAEAA